MKNAISIRTITLDDTEKITRWRNTSFVKKNLYSQEDLTSDQHIAYYHRMIETGKVIQFIISVECDNVTCDIGTAFLKNIDTHSKKAEFGMFIGEQEALGKGYGQAATQMVVDYAFSNMQLNRVYLSVFADNVFAIRAYEKSGFVIEGNLRQDFMRYDGYADVIIMGMTRDKWNLS